MKSNKSSVEPDGQPEQVMFTTFQTAAAHSWEFAQLLKQHIICPAEIKEWACKHLDSHKGEHC